MKYKKLIDEQLTPIPGLSFSNSVTGKPWTPHALLLNDGKEEPEGLLRGNPDECTYGHLRF